MMDNSLNMTRVGMILKRDILENWKKNLLGLVGLYAGMLCCCLIFLLEYKGESVLMSQSSSYFEEFCDKFFAVIVIISIIWAMVTAAQIMQPMETEKGRISFLMLPATRLEKFISRFLYVTVGFIVMMAIVVVLTEISRYLLMPLLDVPAGFYQSTLPEIGAKLFHKPTVNIISDDANTSFSYSLGYYLGFVFLLWNQSLFMLGGSYWYKRAFLKTLATMIVFPIVIGIVAAILPDAWFFISLNEWTPGRDELYSVLQGIAIILILFTLFNWWLSYRLFSRAQITKRKLF